MNELDLINQTQNGSVIAQTESSRAITEVQAAFIMAKKFPRDLNAAHTRIMKSCERLNLAKQAVYSYPKGTALVTGPSIRLAEELARSYGNLDFGVNELERKGNVSIVQSYCIDLETNTRQVKVFEVAHEVKLKTGVRKVLSDPRDIYEHVANYAARRMRACILGIIPGDFVDDALVQCRKTLAKGDGKMTMSERIRQALLLFSQLQVTQEMIEKRLGHKSDLITEDEMVDLQGIYNSLRDKQSKRSDFFDTGEVKQDEIATNFSEKLKGNKTEQAGTENAE